LIRSNGRSRLSPDGRCRAVGTIDDRRGRRFLNRYDFYAIRLRDQVDAEAILITVAEVLEASAATLGHLFAGESRWCCFCDRGLTNPTSQALGCGPDCALRFGLPTIPSDSSR
jgi:hypothetical protein